MNRTRQRYAPQLFDSLHTFNAFCCEELIIDTVTVPEREMSKMVNLRSFNDSLAAAAEPTAKLTTKHRTKLSTLIPVTIKTSL
jgi:hypothetical protein